MKPLLIRLLLFFTPFLPLQENPSANALLSNPFDLQKFKKAKGPSNSGLAREEKYYHKPAHKGVYFCFFMFRSPGFVYSPSADKKESVRSGTGLEIVTHKPLGKYRDNYFDPTETLIEVVAWYNDNDLPELAFVGLDTTVVKGKLGDRFIRKENCFIYSNVNNALVLNISGSTVKWLKYTRLNTAITRYNIPEGLTVNMNKNLKVQ
jgi:hypothetical protein